jgi:twitching motility protein PilT
MSASPDSLDEIVLAASQKKASDLLFSRGGVFVRSAMAIEALNRLVPPNFPECLFDRLDAEDRARAREFLEGPQGAADFSINAGGRRTRVNVYRSSEGICAALRLISDRAFLPEEIDLDPKVTQAVLSKSQGLILVTGPTGSGKSTTVTALVEKINRDRAANIITIEDPVEFVYTPKSCTIQQREVGRHVGSFGEAIRSAMRQNPDVIVVGEIRDAETMRAALQAAETGHLIFATLHTKRVYNTVSRLIGFAPPHEQSEARGVLANNLIAVICQRLIARKDGRGVAAIREILLQTPATATLIREAKERQLGNVMSTNQTLGMVDYNNSLRRLMQAGVIDAQTLRDESDEN